MKKVLLFSGGFDSILYEWLLKPDVLLYVDLGTVYANKEIEQLNNLPERYTERLRIKKLPLGEYEDEETKYLPYRNLLLVTIGMYFGQDIYLGFNSEDNAPDKDATFLRKAVGLFQHLNINAEFDMGWENNNCRISSPFMHLSKTQLLRKALKEGFPLDIRNVRTCYDGVSDKGCGLCPPCLKKSIALLNNDISVKGVFDNDITVSALCRHIDERQEYLSIMGTDTVYLKIHADEGKTAIRKLQKEKK